jgi:hypothetical protein
VLCEKDDVVRIRSDEGEFTEIEFIFPHAARKERKPSTATEGKTTAKAEEKALEGSTTENRGKEKGNENV